MVNWRTALHGLAQVEFGFVKTAWRREGEGEGGSRKTVRQVPTGGALWVRTLSRESRAHCGVVPRLRSGPTPALWLARATTMATTQGLGGAKRASRLPGTRREAMASSHHITM